MSGHRRSRRDVLATVGAAGAAGLAGCLGDIGGGGGGGTPTVGTARLSTGATSMVAPIIVDRGWDEEQGFELDVATRDSISAYYGDFVSGTYGTLPFGPSAAASRYLEGVDLRIVAGFDLSSNFWMTDDDEVESVADMEGETVAAPLGSGSYAVANSMVQQVTGSAVEDLAANVVNAPGPAAPMQELVAGDASVALSWEPALSTFVLQSEDPVRPIMDVRSQYRDAFGEDSFHLVWAVDAGLLDENEDAVRGLVEASGQVGDLYADDPEAAIDTVVENTENDREPLVEAVVDTGRLEWALEPLSAVRGAVETQFDVLSDLGIIDEAPDDGIFADL